MLSKKNCLKKKKDFSRVFKEGKKINGKFVYIKIFPNNLLESRFGIIISKKVIKKAVLRNRLKRQTRFILKNILPKIKTNIDCIVFFLSYPEDFNLIKEDIEKSFLKLRIYV